MKVTIKKTKPIARALIIKSKGSMPKGAIASMMGNPMQNLIKTLMTGDVPSLSMPKPDMANPEYDDRHMVLHTLRSIKAIASELEERACGCDPMPLGQRLRSMQLKKIF